MVGVISLAAWALVGIVLGVAAAVAGFDWWANTTGHVTISGQIHMWMQDQLIGPLVVGVLSGAFGGFLYHFLINK